MNNLLNLTRMELFKIKQRLLSKVLLSVLLSMIALSFFGLYLLAFVIISSAQNKQQTQGQPTQTGIVGQNSLTQGPGIIIQTSTPLPLTTAQGVPPTNDQGAQKAGSTSDDLTFAYNYFHEMICLPGGFWLTFERIINRIGALLIPILASIIVGNEYTNGTVRLISARGVGRISWLAAKTLSIFICTIIGCLVGLAGGTILSLLFNLTDGAGIGALITLETPLILVRIIAATSLSLLLYGCYALAVATIFRSTAAGIAVVIIYTLSEGAVAQVLALIYRVTLPKNGEPPPLINRVVDTIPDYLIGTNSNALVDATIPQSWVVDLNAQELHISGMHSFIVVTCLTLAFWLTAFVIVRRRDITD